MIAVMVLLMTWEYNLANCHFNSESKFLHPISHFIDSLVNVLVCNAIW